MTSIAKVKFYNDGRHKKRVYHHFYVILNKKGVEIKGRPKASTNRYYSKDKKLILVKRNSYRKSALNEITVEIQYRNGNAIITDCHYYDRIYSEKLQGSPETLSTVYFKCTRREILNIINQELNAYFTDIIFVSDNSLSIDSKMPLCGNI